VDFKGIAVFWLCALGVFAWAIEQVLSYTWFLTNVLYFSIPEGAFRVTLTLMVLCTCAAGFAASRNPRGMRIRLWLACQGFWLAAALCTILFAIRVRGYVPGLFASCVVVIPGSAFSIWRAQAARFLPSDNVGTWTIAGAAAFLPLVVVVTATAWLAFELCTPWE